MSIRFVWALVFTVVCIQAEQSIQASLPEPEAASSQAVSVASIKSNCHVDDAGDDPAKVRAALTCVQMAKQAFETGRAIDKALSGLSNPTAVRKTCDVDAAGVDLKKLSDALACVLKAKTVDDQTQTYKQLTQSQLQAFREELSPVEASSVTEAVEASSHSFPRDTTPDTEEQSLPAKKDKSSAANAAPQTPSNGNQIQGSVYTSPSACVTSGNTPDNGLALDHPELLGVRRELLAPKEASDIYGHRLGKRYIIYQVRISDYSKDYQYVVHDISLNLRDILLRQGVSQFDMNGKPLRTSAFLASSRDLDVLRGIPEKGQDYDPRNLSLHILTGIGSVAGGVSGLTAFSDTMGSAVSVFNGAFLQAFVGILPDHTSTQLNRLSDQAFTSNTLVDKLHTKVFAIFIPQSLVLTGDQQTTFWREPQTLLTGLPLDQVDVCVDGSLVTEVAITTNPAFSITDSNVAAGTKVSITDSDANAAIYFTQDGSTAPTASEADKYTSKSEITISSNKTIKAIAVSPNKQQSSVVSQSYIVVQRVPTAKPAPTAEAVTGPLNIVLTPAESTDKLYCSTDGSIPVIEDKGKCASSIKITASTTLKVVEVSASGQVSWPVVPFVYKVK